jgi:diaminopimelate decarboxylase
LTEVLYLKPGRSEQGAGKNFCIVDAAMNDLMRPALYQAWMAIEPCRRRDAAPTVWDVVGPVCESGDWLGRERALAVMPGDMLAVLSAGAYAMSMASNYNSRARAAEVMLVDGQAVLIRERERIEDLMVRERLLPGA